MLGGGGGGGKGCAAPPFTPQYKNDINPLKSKIFLDKALLAETGNLFGDKLPLHLIVCISKQDGKSNKLGAYAILFESSGSDKSRSLGLSFIYIVSNYFLIRSLRQQS